MDNIIYNQLQQLDTLRLNFGNNGSLILNVVLAFIMFGVALGIRPQQFKVAAKHPRAVLTGLLSQWILLPAVTFVFVFLLKDYLTLTVALGAILVASCPGGNVSNFISSLSRGNIELSVSLTAITTVCAVFVTPANFAFWGNLFAGTSGLVRTVYVPLGEVFKTLVFILGLPLVAGILFSWKLPNIAQKIARPIQKISVLCFMIIVVLAFAANFDFFVKYIKFIFITVLIQNGLAFSTGYLASTILKTNERDRRTITIETGIQNSGLALMLIFNPTIFPPDIQTGGMAFIAAWWGVWHILAGLTIATFWNFNRAKKYKMYKNRN